MPTSQHLVPPTDKRPQGESGLHNVSQAAPSRGEKGLASGWNRLGKHGLGICSQPEHRQRAGTNLRRATVRGTAPGFAASAADYALCHQYACHVDHSTAACLRTNYQQWPASPLLRVTTFSSTIANAPVPSAPIRRSFVGMRSDVLLKVWTSHYSTVRSFDKPGFDMAP